jgi:threonine aldolase
MSKPQQFASDNYSGICPAAFEKMSAANQAHEQAYGNDRWTQQATDQLRHLFETNCDVYFVFNGTSANSLAVSALCRSYHSIICHELAHIDTDECGAPEFFSNGSKILTAPGTNGKLTADSIERVVTKRTDLHFPKPKVISLTQSTEVGTVYTRDELLEIRNIADKYDLRIHMDGARFANAIASLGVAPKTVTWQCGVDVLCFGGTKNGLAVGEAVIFFNRKLAQDFEYQCKQAGQLASKMRFLSAPWLGLLENNVWLHNASHSNRMAQLLAQEITTIPGVQLLFPVQANAVFAELPLPAIQALLARGWLFYTFIGQGGVRLMCSWDTTAESVLALAQDLRAVMTA